jgi:hypothetical protein
MCAGSVEAGGYHAQCCIPLAAQGLLDGSGPLRRPHGLLTAAQLGLGLRERLVV